MTKSRCLILLCSMFLIANLLAALKVELMSDRSATAEISQDKGKRQIVLALTFVPVTTLDAVSNNEMTGILAQFFVEEALSLYLKKSKTVDFSKVSKKVIKNNTAICYISYKIPQDAIKDIEVKKEQVHENLKKYLLPTKNTTNDLLQDFRSTCFRDLRTAEVLFCDQIKTCKKPIELIKKINIAFDTIKQKIDDDDALFISEKQGIYQRIEKIKKFLLKKINGKNEHEERSIVINSANDDLITNASFDSDYEPYLRSDRILLEVGGCRVFQKPDGRQLLVGVGYTDVRNNSGKERIRQRRVAEQKAFAALAKKQKVDVYVFSQRNKSTTVATQNRIESSLSKRTSSSRITVKSEAYFASMQTIGYWYSKDGKLFFLAKGCHIINDIGE